MFLDRFRYELRIMGKWVVLIPVLMIVSFVVLAVLLTIMHVEQLRVSQVLTASLEMMLPLSAALVLATITSHDAAIELQLTLPKTYRLTAVGRLALITVWTGAIALFASVFIYHLKFWRIPSQLATWAVLPQFLIGQLTWIAPLLWFVAIGFCLTLLLRSRSASSALLGGIWTAEAIFYGFFATTGWLKLVFLFPTTLDPGIDFWLINRLALLGIALACLVAGWFMLSHTELLLQGTAGEE